MANGTLTLTTPVVIPNITKLAAFGNFDVTAGTLGVVLSLAGGGARQKLYTLTLSDTAGQSRGLLANPNEQGFDDNFVVGGCGAVSALTNAQAAYATARAVGTHAAGLQAVLVRGVTDGWLDASLAGS